MNISLADTRKSLDFTMALIIFLVSAIELLSFGFPDPNNQPQFTTLGDNYLVYWFPLFCTIQFWMFGCFFVFKVIRYKSCIYSKIISYMYFLMQSVNLLSILFSIGYKNYLELITPIFSLSIIFVAIIKCIRWFLK